VNDPQKAVQVDVPLSGTDRFLTLVTTDGGDVDRVDVCPGRRRIRIGAFLCGLGYRSGRWKKTEEIPVNIEGKMTNKLIRHLNVI
jgi:hypothetical protein